MHPINRLLRIVGLQVIRVPTLGRVPASGDTRSSDTERTRVGALDIMIPPSNPLFGQYRVNPDYMSELGRIASHVYAKYPDLLCVDVGANIGDTAAIIRSACPARIVCVEGDRSTTGVLVKNAQVIGDVTVKQTYLSDSIGTRQVAISKDGWNSTLLHSDPTSSAHTVTFLTLDEALRDVDTHLIKLLKVDTEGYDRRVLRGSQRILQTSRPVVLFEHNRENLFDLGEDGLDVFENLRLCGYKAVLFWEDRGRFMLQTTLDDTALIDDLHHYVDRQGLPAGSVHYLDVCAFHEQDEDLAEKSVAGEREARDKRRASGPVRC